MFPNARTFASLFFLLLVIMASHAGSPDAKAQSNADRTDSSTPGTVNINVTIDALNNRHSISSYVYGGAYPHGWLCRIGSGDSYRLSASTTPALLGAQDAQHPGEGSQV
ncbi:MAG TPA: hypothetical protein VMU05_15460 [Dongiaceae bacterium]|nr:hypothetical protein [Dongiaceae bacterium]